MGFEYPLCPAKVPFSAGLDLRISVPFALCVPDEWLTQLDSGINELFVK
jgi:hypothetical protein